MRAARRAARRLRAPPVSDARGETPFSGGCGHCATITMATLERLVARGPRALAGEAHLADGVRLPDEPARPAARRLASGPGALPRRGGAPRVPRAARRHADPLPRPRRGRRRALAERALHRGRRREALGVGVPAAARQARRRARTLWGQVRPGTGATRTGSSSCGRTGRPPGSVACAARRPAASSPPPSPEARSCASTPCAGGASACRCSSADGPYRGFTDPQRAERRARLGSRPCGSSLRSPASSPCSCWSSRRTRRTTIPRVAKGLVCAGGEATRSGS